MSDIYPILLISSGCQSQTVATFIPTEDDLAEVIKDHFGPCEDAPDCTAWATEIVSRLCDEDLYESDVGEDAHICAVARCQSRPLPRYARPRPSDGDCMAAMDGLRKREGWKDVD